MRSKPHAKALQAMRALVAIGIHDEETLVLHAAEALAGKAEVEPADMRTAQGAFDRYMKIMGDG
jgi:hypothetical protein